MGKQRRGQVAWFPDRRGAAGRGRGKRGRWRDRGAGQACVETARSPNQPLKDGDEKVLASTVTATSSSRSGHRDRNGSSRDGAGIHAILTETRARVGTRDFAAMACAGYGRKWDLAPARAGAGRQPDCRNDSHVPFRLHDGRSSIFEWVIGCRRPFRQINIQTSSIDQSSNPRGFRIQRSPHTCGGLRPAGSSPPLAGTAAFR